jgi:hypothetical protein
LYNLFVPELGENEGTVNNENLEGAAKSKSNVRKHFLSKGLMA